MPLGDGTGPDGAGPKTGRGLGPCGTGNPKTKTPPSGRRGGGRGRRRTVRTPKVSKKK